MNQQLITAIAVLAEAATPATLRRALHLLVDGIAAEHAADAGAPDTTTPPMHDIDGAVGGSPPQDVSLPSPSPRRREMRGLQAGQATRPTQPAANSPASDLSARPTPMGWLVLRRQVEAELRRRRMTREELAQQIGYSASSVADALTKRQPPSRRLSAALVAFLAAPRAATPPDVPAAAPDAPSPPAPFQGGAVQATATQAAWSPVLAQVRQALGADRDLDTLRLARESGVRKPILESLLASHARPAEADYDKLRQWLGQRGLVDPTAALALALRTKRRTVALTAGTIAQQAGVDVAELDAAIAGQSVPVQATEKLAAWAAAG